MHTYNLKCIKTRKASTHIALLSASTVPSEEIATLMNGTQGIEDRDDTALKVYMYVYLYVCTYICMY